VEKWEVGTIARASRMNERWSWRSSSVIFEVWAGEDGGIDKLR
jgi:hypothetical protein